MIRPIQKLLLVLSAVSLLSYGLIQKKKVTVYLIGDSTISVKEITAYPETGWGMPFAGFFDSTVVVDNRAKNGRSTKSFIAENLWQPVVSRLNEGDYVFIQFGHNDEGKEKVGRYTTVDEFKVNLLRYVNETRSKGNTSTAYTGCKKKIRRQWKGGGIASIVFRCSTRNCFSTGSNTD